jgi:hypothetical protein
MVSSGFIFPEPRLSLPTYPLPCPVSLLKSVLVIAWGIYFPFLSLFGAFLYFRSDLPLTVSWDSVDLPQ